MRKNLVKLCATFVVALALSVSALADPGDISGGRTGDISGGRNSAGDISGGRNSAGDISGGRTGDISGGRLDIELLLLLVRIFI